jgi:hypothetical protein
MLEKNKIMAVENKEGGISIIRPNWRKFTLDPDEAKFTGKELIEDEEAFFTGEITKQPDTLVTRRKCHDEIGYDGEDDDRAAAIEECDHIDKVVCEESDCPYCGSFRSAWKFNDEKTCIEIDMTKAKEIKTDQVRTARNSKLADDDIEYMRADEAGDSTKKTEVATRKQNLRDLPATIQPELDAISDPEELDNFEPTWP